MEQIISCLLTDKGSKSTTFLACLQDNVQSWPTSKDLLCAAASLSNDMHFRCMHQIAAFGSEAELNSESQQAEIAIPDYCSGCGVKLQDHDPDFPG